MAAIARIEDGIFRLLAALLVCSIAYWAVQMIVSASSLGIGSGTRPERSRDIIEAANGVDEKYSIEPHYKISEQTCGTTRDSTPSLFGNGRHPTGLLHFKGRIFKFFELPRELRDQIIDELLDHQRTLSSVRQSAMKMTVVHFVQNNLLLVNRQFRSEVQERAGKRSGFIFEGISSRLYNYELPNLPLLIPSLPYVELRLIMSMKPDYQLTCSLVNMRRITERMLIHLCEHSALQGIFFNIFVHPNYTRRQLDGTDGLTTIKERLSYLVEDERVKAINVYAPAKCPDLKQLKMTPAWRAESMPRSDDLVLYYTPKHEWIAPD